MLRRDDIVKLAGFLSLGVGKLGQEQLLDPQMATPRCSATKGHRISRKDGEFRYNNGVWAWNIAEYAGCKNPHGSRTCRASAASRSRCRRTVVYYYVSDGGVFRWARAVAETSRLRSVCPEGRPDGG